MSGKTKSIPEVKSQKVWRPFRAHDNMLLDMVTRQTTKFEKAVMELIMNGVDAGATKIGVSLSNEWLQVQDNGKGLPHAEEEMLECFQMVGAPHQLNEHGHSTDAKFGRFRIGRLQMLGYGWVTYKSGPWVLDVRVVDKDGEHCSAKDVHRRKSVGFDQERVDAPFPDSLVAVKLDRKFEPWEVDAMVDQISKWCRYSIVPVFVNGVQVSVHPDETPKEWNLVTKNAWMHLKQGDRYYGSLDIYMHGIYVCSQGVSVRGVSGVVVAKNQMLVDFGRQGISTDCPVWSSIVNSIRGWGAEKFASVKTKASKSEIMACWQDVAVTHDLSAYGGRDKFAGLHVFRDINGFAKSWAALQKAFKEGDYSYTADAKMLLSVAKPGNNRAVKIHEEGHAFVLDESVFSGLFADKGKPLVRRISDALEHWVGLGKLTVLPIDEINPQLRESYEEIPSAKLTGVQQAYVSFLQVVYWTTIRYAERRGLFGGNERARRYRGHISFGNSPTAEAWTDGQSYIMYDWKCFSKLLPLSIGSISHVIRVMQHEMCHDEVSFGSHSHSGDFYKAFHDLQMATERDVMNCVIARMVGYAARAGGPKFRKSDDRKILTHFRDTTLGSKALELWFARERGKHSQTFSEEAWANYVGQDIRQMCEAQYVGTAGTK